MAEGIPGYWSVIPAPVRNDTQLKMSAKLLYADISALCAESGYCWATNAYLAERMGVAVSTISRLVHQLEQRGYVRTEMAATDQGSERHIYAGIFPAEGGLRKKSKTPPGSTQKEQGGSTQKEQDPNKDDKYTGIYTPLIPPKGGKRKRQAKSVPTWKPERFEAFWSYYRDNARGEDRMGAVREWDKLQLDEATIDLIAKALPRQVKYWAAHDGVGVPYACRYLKNRRWEDTPKVSGPAAPSGAIKVESRLTPL